MTTYTARNQFNSIKLYDNTTGDVVAVYNDAETFEAVMGKSVDAYNNQQASRAANVAIESAASLNRD